MPWLESLVRDVRLGLRVHLRNAPVTMAAVLSLALALGASVAAFSLIDALILRPLPVRRARSSSCTWRSTTSAARGQRRASESSTFTDPMFVQLRDGRPRPCGALRDEHAGPARHVISMAPTAEKEQVRTQFVSGDAFTMLGVSPAAGRLLTQRRRP